MGGRGSEEGALETSCNLSHPCQPWVAFLLLLVYLTVLIGTPYACLRTHVHSRLVLRAEKNRKFHLNSTDFKHLSQVPQGRLCHPGRWVRQPGDALEGQQGAPQSQEEGIQPGPEPGTLEKLRCQESSAKNLHSSFASHIQLCSEMR